MTTAPSMQHYCLGFLWNETGTALVLLQKQRPGFQAGRWNGLGGKVEAGETPQQAMAREAMEEANVGLPADDWYPVGLLSDQATYAVHCFAAHAALEGVATQTDEPVHVYPWPVPADVPLAPQVSDILEHLVQQGWPRGASAR